MYPKIGDRIPNMPPEYEQKSAMPAGAVMWLAVDNCPEGKIVYICDGVICHIGDYTDLDEVPSMPFDCVIMNGNDIDAETANEIQKNALFPKLNS